jgi:glutamate-5-semialdehyde dehydrogenase
MAAHAPSVPSLAQQPSALTKLQAGMPLLYGGNRLTYVSDVLASAFEPGDHLLLIQATGELLHIPRKVYEQVATAVERSRVAFAGLRSATDEQIDRFYDAFGVNLQDSTVWSHVYQANIEDVERAINHGRSTTRLVADQRMRRRMLEGIAMWRALPSERGRTVHTIQHQGWSVDEVHDGLGVIGFVFEGRPNVLADATGILRSGNTAVMRIGSDALGTAKALMRHALRPALVAAGLPADSVILIESTEHAAGWALFAHGGLALAVARGSGRATALLGAIARQTGTPISLHGTGGAWIIAGATAQPHVLEAAIFHSLDRKVCNSLNTVCIVETHAGSLVPAVIAGLTARGHALGHGFRLHVTKQAAAFVPRDLFDQRTLVSRPSGVMDEPVATLLDDDQLGVEWEWEQTPEVTLEIVRSVDQAIRLFNMQSPHFVASLIAEDAAAHERFFQEIDAPFAGNGFTRWVDGQFALKRPELGLTNWQEGRLFGRGGILTGDGVFSVRLRARQLDPDVHQ